MKDQNHPVNENGMGRNLTPRELVKELDNYIVGQKAAKRAVAIALRNRWRRQQVQGFLRNEITPKNIIMIGPTGVGKTEIARRLAKLVQAPFIKVEASKFTEVGYVGRDVESMVRDLVDSSIHMVKAEEQILVKKQAKQAAYERVLDILIPMPTRNAGGVAVVPGTTSLDSMPPKDAGPSTREKFKDLLENGSLDEREIEVDVLEQSYPMVEIGGTGMEQMGFDMSQLQKIFGGQPKKKKRKCKVKEALTLLEQEEAEKLIDIDKIQKEALHRAEQFGIIFLDEIDKIASGRQTAGPDVSREGVQRDLLPIVEGTTVTTKYGPIKTDHVLFIAAGAFHVSKPSDLLPEMQGRFPIRVELEPLSKDDLVRILTEPQNSITKQYEALLSTEGVELIWSQDAIEKLAEYAMLANERLENIGARRLQTFLERVLDEISFDAPEVKTPHRYEVTAKAISDKLSPILSNDDLSRYIL